MDILKTMNICYSVVYLLLLRKQHLTYCAVQTAFNAIRKFPLKVILQNENLSVVSAPIHLHILMCKLLEVIDDDDRQEIIKFLGIDSIKEVKECYTQYQPMFNYLNSLDLLWANFLYVNQSKNLLDSFMNTTVYGTGVMVEEVDFNQPDAFIKYFNEMVRSSTLGRLGDVLKPGEVTVKTRLGLVTVAFYKTFWESPFDPQDTKDEQFFGVDKTSFTVPMMKKVEEHANYFEDAKHNIKGAKIVTKLGELTVIVPENPDGLKNFVQDLYDDENMLPSLLAKTTTVQTVIKLPRFQTKCNINMVHIMKNLGVNKIFESNSTGLKNIYRMKFSELNININFAKQNIMFQVVEGFPASSHLSRREKQQLEITQLRSAYELIANKPFYYHLSYNVYGVSHEILSGVYYGPESRTAQV